jgi:hypothetical protein
MKSHLDCFPCFLRQTLIALRATTGNRELQEQVMKAVLEDVARADMTLSPAHTTTHIHRRIRKMIGGDPFADIKAEYNGIALDLYPFLKKTVQESRTPFATAARLAIAGNIIDFGIFSAVDIEGAVSRALGSPLAADDSDLLRAALERDREVLYLLDNAGEIVFDRVFIEELQSLGIQVTAAVKGGPVINDCTRRDAEETGLTGICEVIDNGSDAVGTILEWTSPDFNARFRSAPVVISKGQANFETVQEPDKTVFYLFQSKCDVVSRELGLALKSMILSRTRMALDK